MSAVLRKVRAIYARLERENRRLLRLLAQGLTPRQAERRLMRGQSSSGDAKRRKSASRRR